MVYNIVKCVVTRVVGVQSYYREGPGHDFHVLHTRIYILSSGDFTLGYRVVRRRRRRRSRRLLEHTRTRFQSAGSLRPFYV